ncbi:WhiB family transcriptional regulator [Georgenia wangjunii]|uniref:WhiB family transcriptional regulator n=1 Tax=Georgenia wangjunii TaxID=3117730 RepID=UPI002F2648A2
MEPARRAALSAFLDELDRHNDAGAVIPCRGGAGLEPGAWIDDDGGELSTAAAAACGACPALAACARYVEDFPEPAGIWAGVTSKDRRNRRRRERRRSNQPMDDNDETTTAPEPTCGQVALARDALAVVRAQTSGDAEGAALLVHQLVADPGSVPGVVGSLVSMLEAALQLPPMSASEFVEGMAQTLDGPGQ